MTEDGALATVKRFVVEYRYRIYSFISLWKIALIFVGVIIYVKYILEDDLSALFTSASASFGQHLINVTEVWQHALIERQCSLL